MKAKVRKFLKSGKEVLSKIKLYKKTDIKVEELPNITFEYFQGISYGNMYMRMYQAQFEGFTILKQTNTKIDRHGCPKGKPITFYFIEGHDKEYKNLMELITLLRQGQLK